MIDTAVEPAGPVAGPAPRIGWTRVWQGLALAFAVLVITSNVLDMIDSAQGTPWHGSLGANLTPREDARRDDRLSTVRPGGPLAQAGAKAGDLIHFDHPVDDVRDPLVGETIGLTLFTAHGPRHLTLTATPRADQAGNSRVEFVDGLSALLGSLVALVILWRSQGRASLIALGLLFAATNLTFWMDFQETLAVYPAWLAVSMFNAAAFGPLFILFALIFYGETVGPIRRSIYLMLASYTALVYAVAFDLWCYRVIGQAWVPPISLVNLASWLQALGEIVGLGCLVWGWRRSERDLRQRYAFMLAAVACLIVAVIMSVLAPTLGMSLLQSPMMIPFEIIATAAPLMFAYAVLRDKVLDLGFAINRTLVYGAISTGLLVVFGLIEWGSERLLPHEAIEASALINAAVALAIFLAFHRIRDFVERLVERSLFRSWHDNEARLRRFVKEAAFVGKPEALRAAAVAAFARFSGAASALYLRQGEDYVLEAGGLDGALAAIDSDDPAVVALRAAPEVLDLADHHTRLAGALVLPMTHRSELDGFILLGLKPDGASYRPDEVQVLGWAAHQIGLDLHALKVAALEQRVFSLEERNGELRGLLRQGEQGA